MAQQSNHAAAASTNIDTYMSLSQSAIDGASSLPQLYEIGMIENKARICRK